MILQIYTDGACSGNPGPGGWGVVMLYGDKRRELSGFAPDTTNNRMELLAVIEALSAIKTPTPTEIYSDSKYIIDALTKGWLTSWQRNGWKTSAKQPVKNQDLWEQLIILNATHNPTYHWVKGHSTNPHNNRADELAVAEIKRNML